MNIEGDWIEVPNDGEIVVVSAELLREAIEIFEAAEEEVADEDVVCGTCRGSGEGYHDGSHCGHCGGSGCEYIVWKRSSYLYI